MANSDLVASVLKALDLLTILAESNHSMRLSELAAHAGLKPPACRNLLRTMMARNFVTKEENNGYIIGNAITDLARRSRDKRLVNFAEKGIRELYKLVPECTLTFWELTPDVIRCLLRMSPDRPGEVQHPEGYTFPPYSAVTCRCLQALACYGTAYEEHFPFEEFGKVYFPSQKAFLADRKKILKNEYAVYLAENRSKIAFFFPDRFSFAITCKCPFPVEISEMKKMIDRLRQEAKMC